MEPCQNQERIKQMEAIIFGGEQPGSGLIGIVTEINTTMKSTTQALEGNSIIQKELLAYMYEQKGIRKGIEKTKTKNIWLTAISISSGIALLSIIITLIIKINQV